MTSLSVRKSPARLAFVHFVRTGIRLPESTFARPAGRIEMKFNPNHDPTNGQFTFGSGGGTARRTSRNTDSGVPSSFGTIPSLATDQSFQPDRPSDGVYRPGDAPSLVLTGAGSEPPMRMGGNYGAFLDPMTLDQAFPGLNAVPGGSIIAASANILNLTGPGTELTDQMSLDYTRALIADIKSIDPSYHFQTWGFPEPLEGQISQINDLRWDRAAAIYRVSGSAAPLQVETLRFLQERVDAEYDKALAEAKAGRLPFAPTERMAIGNFVDRAVKEDFRDVLGVRNLSARTGQAVHVSSREYDSSGEDLTYSIPDARVKDVAYDITLAAKNLSTRQVRQFFNSDFKPSSVVIVRPRQLGPNSTYVITRPRK